MRLFLAGLCLIQLLVSLVLVTIIGFQQGRLNVLEPSFEAMTDKAVAATQSEIACIEEMTTMKNEPRRAQPASLENYANYVALWNERNFTHALLEQIVVQNGLESVAGGCVYVDGNTIYATLAYGDENGGWFNAAAFTLSDDEWGGQTLTYNGIDSLAL